MNIIWSPQSLRQVIATYEYWNERNQSKRYSNKLEKSRVLAEKRISKNPCLFPQTKLKNIRVYIVSHFKIFYEIHETEIHIISFFDSRQRPKIR
jgi:toxin YoeB